MKSITLMLIFSSLAPVLCVAQKKEAVIEIQRDVAQLQDQVKTLQKSQDEKLTTLTTLLQQSLENTNRLNAQLAVLQDRLGEKLSGDVRALVSPIAGVGTKIDQMADDFRNLRESVADINTRVGKLDQKVTDIRTAMTTIPAAPTSGGSSPAMPPPSSGGPPAGASAESLYQNGYRDLSSGNLDLALSEFTDYLKYYTKTDLAPNAQYYIGDIYYRKGDFDSSVTAFDGVLERFPENNKTVDARYMKGMSLLKSGQRTKAAQEFREIVKRYPNNELATKARGQLKSLGLNVSSTAPPPKGSRRR